MINEINKEILDNFYSRALFSYLRCIGNPENIFLSEEIGMNISKVLTKNDTVSIKYNGTNLENFVIEVKLILLSEKGLELGYFTSVLDEKQNELDDFLVFK
ncbi:hypothetical protein D3C87_228140 [compost metagenome]